MSEWKFLSYQLSNVLSAYRNGERISIDQVSSIKDGGSCNQSKIDVNLHFGTHIDFPLHFLEGGKNCSDYYDANFFVVESICLIELNQLKYPYLVSVEDLEPYLKKTDSTLECIVIKTGLCYHRLEDRYWNDNVGMNTDVAAYCRNRFPRLRFIGFDFMSVSGIHDRMLGRKVHKEFFQNDIIPIEDMNLTIINKKSTIEKMIISPYRVCGADAAPVTVIAQIKD